MPRRCLSLVVLLLLVAAVVVALGECLHTTVLMPLVADLAPAALRGRYMAVTALSWWLALAPTLAAQLLSVSPPAAMLASAVVALAAAAAALALEDELPAAIRLTPRPAQDAAGGVLPRTVEGARAAGQPRSSAGAS